MSDTIYKQQAIDALTELREKTVASESFRLGIYYAIDEIKNLPSAQCKTGKWIDDIVSYSDTGDIILANCYLCGYQMDVVYEHGYFRYCPNCGARMDGESYE